MIVAHAGGLIFFTLLLIFAYVVVIYIITDAEEKTGITKVCFRHVGWRVINRKVVQVFLYFVSTARLVIGQEYRWVRALRGGLCASIS